MTHATVRFLLPSGSVVTRTYDLAPGSRTTVYVNQVPGLDETDVSGDISADARDRRRTRDVSQRAPGRPFTLGTGGAGVTTAATQWFLAEGATGSFFDLFVLIANPGGTDALVDAHYARPDGSVVTRRSTVRANSRFSVYVDAIAGLESTAVATTIISTNGVPIVVERAMYWPGGLLRLLRGPHLGRQHDDGVAMGRRGRGERRPVRRPDLRADRQYGQSAGHRAVLRAAPSRASRRCRRRRCSCCPPTAAPPSR